MFPAKMVYLIQKLFGRDDDSSTGESSELSTSELDMTVDRKQTEPDDGPCFSILSNQQHRLYENLPGDRAKSESDRLMSVSLPSSCQSRSVSIPDSKSDVRTDLLDQSALIYEEKLIAQDNSSGASFYPSCSLLASALELVPSSSEDLWHNGPFSTAGAAAAAAAEPVCCCDTCALISDSCGIRHEQLCLKPYLSSTPGSMTDYAQPPSYSLCQPSGLRHFSSGCSSHSSCLPCVKNASSAVKKTACREKLPHQMEQQLNVRSLPPMISISPDGEEGFECSQRLLQHICNRCKPFYEVPPNKTICHVQCKFTNSK